MRSSESIRVGVLTDEPIRLEGLASIFESRHGNGLVTLSPVIGTMEELLSDPDLAYIIMDMNSPAVGVGTLESIRHRRPDMRSIIIGPEGNDNLVLDLIMAGARAYLDLKASPRIVRQAIDAVVNGSIWAPRRLLSKLIDRLLCVSDTSLANPARHLTDRERQVLELILMARSNREIARHLGIEERTVKAHVGRLMRKTGADNRIELSIQALSRSLVPGATINERRERERRHSDRRQPKVFVPRSTPKEQSAPPLPKSKQTRLLKSPLLP